MKLLGFLLCIAMLVGACGEIRSSTRLAQTLNETRVAGIGDTVVEVNREESLPNAFGKADLFGRTRPTGRVLVLYQGTVDGRAIFERIDVRLQSNATTMNSSPLVIPQSSTTTYTGTTTVGGLSATTFGTAQTSAPPVVLPPSGSETQIISADRSRYYVDLSNEREFVVEGYSVVIEGADASLLRYRVRRLPGAN